VRKFVDSTSTTGFGENRDNWQDDAIGGRYYYQGRAEVEIPLGSGAREMGLRPSVYVDVGSVWGIKTPVLNDVYTCTDSTGSTSLKSSAVGTTPAGCGSPELYSREFFYGNTPKPRVAVGFGFNWNSPFGPFRLDFAKNLMKAEGDDPKTFTFNVGTQF
jgi:outer membrane protein insertion porin family